MSAVTPSILIVEDDANVSALLAFAFGREGFEPTVLRDGRSAVEHVANSAPADVVVLDVMLPCRDGYAIAAAIRSDPRWSRVPIVVLSGQSADHEQERARAAGATAFFSKPFRPLALVESVRSLLRMAAA